MRFRSAPFAWLLMGLTGTAIAQSDTPPRFEVATIKPADPSARGKQVGTPGRNLRLLNYSLKDLMAFAWGIESDIIVGGPPWLDSTHFDLLAKPEGPPPQSTSPVEIMKWYGLMMQSLLTDRFQLSVHHETREASVYALLRARSDGKLGPRLIEATEGSCRETTLFQPAATSQEESPKVPSPVCGGYTLRGRRIQGSSMELGQLAEFLGQWVVRRTIIDKTGLKQKFDISLEWTSDEDQVAALRPSALPPDNDLSIFRALQEQLGLKLESQKGQVDAVVIDRAEKPSDN
jgi:uncharacterized protein (TIGR03435 family)